MAFVLALAVSWISLLEGRLPAADASPPLDPPRVRALMRRVQAGETLSAEDQDYLNYARQQIRQRI